MYFRYHGLCPMLFGKGAISLLGAEAKELGCSKVLLVTDEIMSQQPAYRTCKESLNAEGIACVEFTKCLPDPPDWLVFELGALAAAEQVDGMVAFGGGSIIDATKAASVVMNNPPPLSLYYGNYNYKPGVPIIAIPTTSGTGSETTKFAVISDTELVAKKTLYVHAALGILDPEVTLSVPSGVTAGTGMDALAHSVEAMTSLRWNPQSELLGFDSIRRIVQWLPAAVRDGSDLEARSEMMLASNFAGSAFNDGGTHLGHALAQTIGAHCHVAHGVACALSTPETIRFCAAVVPDKVKLIGKAMGVIFTGYEDNDEIGERVAVAVCALMRQISIPSLKELGCSRQDIVGVAEFVLNEKGLLALPRPEPLTVGEVQIMLGNMYDNY